MDIQLVAGLSEFHDAATRKLYLALDELYYDESAVQLPLYKKLQPIVHAAVESK